MKYYKIQIFDTENNLIETFDSHYQSGLPKTGALKVEFTAPVAPEASTNGNVTMRIYGLPIRFYGQSYSLNQCTIRVWGGMAKGLPLSNPNHKGLIFQGLILASYTLWEGITAFLELIVTTGGNTVLQPENLILRWGKGQQLADALREVFNEYITDIRISDRLIIDFQNDSKHLTFRELANYVKQYSINLLKEPNYKGVEIVFENNVIKIFDGTAEFENIIQLDFKDFIGQPQWLFENQITFTVMQRGDIRINSNIKMPERLLAQYTMNSSVYDMRKGLNFTGTFQVIEITQVGDSYNNDPQSWVTLIVANKII